MSKKSSNKSGRHTLGALDPVKLFTLLEDHFVDVDTSPYRRVYAEARQAFLVADGGNGGAVAFAALLDSIDASSPIEYASRGAGFVVGFETCRRLLLGELDLVQLKDGAR